MSRIKILVLTAAIILGTPCRAQFTDGFADGDFFAAPAWLGEVTFFDVVNHRLKLQAPPVTGSAQLVTQSAAVHEASWEFTLQLDFTPSSSNYAKIFLMADRPELRQAINGYFVKIGGTSREVSLYRQTGSTEFELIDGLDDRVNLPLVNLRVRVTRDGAGQWELFSDVGVTGNASTEGMANDVTHTASSWFGVLCVYTATRSDRFWFDDFVVNGSVVPDLLPPVIVDVQAEDPHHIRILFSESIALPTIQRTSVLVKGNGHPVSVMRTDSGKVILCSLSQPLVNGVDYELEVSGLSDSVGNVMPVTKVSVRYFRPGRPVPKCVLITEVFPDPSPQVGLPGIEYIELYNPGPEPFELGNWVLSDGSSSGSFPDHVLLPKTYLVVTSSSGDSQFGEVSVVGLANFPSLNNGGDHLVLTDNSGQPIDSVNYSPSWYRDEDKASGGWSLELIDQTNPCGEGENWTASADARGGTPGEPNSVAAYKPDLTPPVVHAVRTTDSSRVIIVFNELLQSLSTPDINVQLEPAVTVRAMQLDVARREVELHLGAGLLKRTPYRIRLSGIRDCAGNSMDPAEVSFGLSESADSADVLISEVLFNPRPGGEDFVELYNASAKYIDLENGIISNGESDIQLAGRQLAPGEWLALTADDLAVRNHYPLAANGAIQTSGLPALPDDEGLVLLYNASGRLLDRVQYADDWHSRFLRSSEGVSLERIAYTSPAQNRDNWGSASSLAGFATPGLPNSHQRYGNPATAAITVIPEVFSPASVPYDFVQIHYRFDQSVTVANARIYDRNGVLVKELANNVTLGTEGFLRWDGDRDNGSRALAGYYMLWVEYFDSTGRVETVRRRIVVAVR